MGKRKKLHDEFFRVRGYQIINDFSDQFMADHLGCAPRTYRDKVSGWIDFQPLEGKALVSLFGVSQDVLFYTRDVSR